jgi:hypothetical protein
MNFKLNQEFIVTFRTYCHKVNKLSNGFHIALNSFKFVIKKGGCYMFLTKEVLKHLLTFHGFIKQQNI